MRPQKLSTLVTTGFLIVNKHYCVLWIHCNSVISLISALSELLLYTSHNERQSNRSIKSRRTSGLKYFFRRFGKVPNFRCKCSLCLLTYLLTPSDRLQRSWCAACTVVNQFWCDESTLKRPRRRVDVRWKRHCVEQWWPCVCLRISELLLMRGFMTMLFQLSITKLITKIGSDYK